MIGPSPIKLQIIGYYLAITFFVWSDFNNVWHVDRY